nr:hypothetical protein [Tanacetum cinerariifolium]
WLSVCLLCRPMRKKGCATWDGGKGTWRGRAKGFGTVSVCVRVQESENGGGVVLAGKLLGFGVFAEMALVVLLGFRLNRSLRFLPEGCIDDNQCSLLSISVNNEAPVIDANPLTSIHPSDFVKDVVDFDDASARDNENPLVGTSLPPLPEAGKKLRSLDKRKLPFRVGDSLPKV